MPNLNELLAIKYQNEYESAYDLPMKRNFSNPKIYSANGDLKKRWYVYFSFRDPKNGKLKRFTPVYGKVNIWKQMYPMFLRREMWLNFTMLF